MSENPAAATTEETTEREPVYSTVGIRDLVAAEVEEDTKEGTEYGDVFPVVGAIEWDMTDQSGDPDEQYYDDIEGDVLYKDPKMQVDLELADIPPAVQAILLNYVTDQNGVLVKKAGGKPKYFAFGFKSEKSNGEDRYIWYYKGRCTLPNQKHATKRGEDITRQTQKLRIIFIKRTSDNLWQTMVDENTTAFASAKATFFDAPYEPSFQAVGG